MLLMALICSIILLRFKLGKMFLILIIVLFFILNEDHTITYILHGTMNNHKLEIV
jgi:hypothetical protein